MTRIPEPGALGLPSKYSRWRSGQEDAIHQILNAKKRAVEICAPTGFGKTGCILAAAKLSNKPTCIVTLSRGLQDQYMDEGAGMGLVDIRGRKNYTCGMRPDEYTCEDGYNARCPYKGTVQCPSSQAEIRASLSKLVVTNYDKWTASRSFGNGMDHFEQVIFDEGHAMPEALAKAMQTKLHHKEIEETLGIDFLAGTEADSMQNWKMWAVMARSDAEQAMLAAKIRLRGVHDPKPSWVRHYAHMRNLVRRLNIIALANPKDWVVDQTEGGFQFDPIRPARYAEVALLQRVPRIVAISATIQPKTMFLSGLGKDKFDFFEYQSDFDPNRCPVYWVPTMRVKYGMDLSMLWLRIDQLAAKRPNTNAIIHTISFARRDDLLRMSRFSDRMLINPRGEPPTPMIEQFKDSAPGTILVSPSVGTGYDFPDDECRWQVVCKVPFEPPSKILQARQNEDNEYVYYRAMQYLVQAFGRDMRSKTDWSQRFIFDDQCEWFIPRYRHLAPKSFRAVFKRSEFLPPPLNL